MKKTVEEALVTLFKGQSNVKLMANEMGMPLAEMQQLFREYVARTPVDEDVWEGDIVLSWPYSGN